METTNKYLNQTGLAVLWERIKQLVYECSGGQSVTYRLERDGSNLVLVGSDGTRSVVDMSAITGCELPN